MLYINAIYTTTAIFIVEISYKSLIFAVFMPIKEKIANTLVSAILNSNGRTSWVRTNEMVESESTALPLGYSPKT